MPDDRLPIRTAIVCLALLLEGICSSSINVQVGAIRDDFGSSRAEMALVVSSFLVAYGGLLTLAGRLVDNGDRRRLFLIGVALFGTGCAVSAAAVDTWMVTAGRFLQGAGAAMSAPAALAIATAGLPAGPQRNRVVALYGAMGAAGFSIGLVVPGFVVDAVGWRASFAVLLPIVAVVLAATWGLPAGVPAGREHLRAIDPLGAGLLTAALMLGLHALSGVGTASNAQIIMEWAVVAVLGALLLARRHRRRLAVSTFRSDVRRSCLGLASVFAGVVASMYVVSLALQVRDGADATAVGLAILPQPIAFTSLSGLGARAVSHWGARRTLAAGALVVAGGVAYADFAAFRFPTVLGMAPAMAMIGAGLALVFPAASIGAVDGAPAEERGSTAALLSTWQNVGGAVGIALVTALALVPEATGDDPSTALRLCAGVAAAGALAVLVGRRAQRLTPLPSPAHAEPSLVGPT